MRVTYPLKPCIFKWQNGPMELVAQDLIKKFPINIKMNDVSGIGSCAEKGVSVLDPLQKKLANGIFQLFELDTI